MFLNLGYSARAVARLKVRSSPKEDEWTQSALDFTLAGSENLLLTVRGLNRTLGAMMSF